MARRATSTGRQRVEIKKIENSEALQVTFSKRRNGLFKKACELAILCGAEVLILVFSPAGRPYSFGSPDVQSLVDRYLAGNPTHVVDPYMGKGLLVRRLASQFMDLTTIRDKERERISNLRRFVKDLDVPKEEDLGDEELEKYVAALDNLKTRLADHIERLRFWEANANYNNPPPDVCPHNNGNIFTPMEALIRGEHILPHPHNSAMGFMNFQYNHHVDQQIKMLEPIDYYCRGNLQYDHVGNIAQASAAQNNLHVPGGASVDVGDYIGPGVPPFGAHQLGEWNNEVNYHGGI